MAEPSDPLERIADALERLSPAPAAPADWETHPYHYWDGERAEAFDTAQHVALDLLTGIDAQKRKVAETMERHAQGLPAHDVLLWGARGMGKSALVKAALADRIAAGDDLALVQASGEALATLPRLFAELGKTKRRFILFIDDIGFEGDASAARTLRSLLEGGTLQRPANVRLFVTSNRRHIVGRNMDEQDDPVNPRDVVDDRLALADRFGLSLGFHTCDQDDYLAIVRGYAEKYALQFDEADALLWAKQRGARSGRVAWHYIVEVAGRAGKPLG